MFSSSPAVHPDGSGRYVRLGVRLTLIVLLGLLIGRLYQLQVREHNTFAAQADANRLRTIEIPAARGLIFDRNGELLARNRPSYQLAIVPEELPDDDLDTEADEEYEAILQILESLGPNLDRNAVLDMQRNLHRSLGWLDYRRILVDNKVSFSVFEIPYSEFVDLLIQIGVVDATTVESAPIEEEAAAASMVSLPDLNQPLPIEGLAFLIQNLAQTRQQGNSSEPFPIPDRPQPGSRLHDFGAVVPVSGQPHPGRVRTGVCLRGTGQPHSWLYGSDSLIAGGRLPPAGIFTGGTDRPVGG